MTVLKRLVAISWFLKKGQSNWNSSFLNFEFRSSSWLEIQLQLEIRVLKILNFDLRGGSKFNPSSKFRFRKYWISIFKLARNSNPARNSVYFFILFLISIFDLARNSTPAGNSAFENFEFWSLSWLEIQLQLKIQLWFTLNFDL